MGTKKERTEAEDTRELSRAEREIEKVVGVERRKQLIVKEISGGVGGRERDVHIARKTEREGSITTAVFAISSHPVIRPPLIVSRLMAESVFIRVNHRDVHRGTEVERFAVNRSADRAVDTYGSPPRVSCKPHVFARELSIYILMPRD